MSRKGVMSYQRGLCCPFTRRSTPALYNVYFWISAICISALIGSTLANRSILRGTLAKDLVGISTIRPTRALADNINSTNANDVESIQSVVQAFLLQSESVGDPCLPKPWDWLVCSTDQTPRIQTINLASRGLSGIIPPHISNLDALTTLNLQFNSLVGPFLDLTGMGQLESVDLHTNQLGGNIPPQIGNLLSLKHLDLSNNPMDGDVPLAVATRVSSGSLDLNINGTNLCIQLLNGTKTCNHVSAPAEQGPQPKSKPILSTVAIIAIVAAVLAVNVFACTLIFCCFCKKSRGKNDSDSGPAGPILQYDNFKGSSTWTTSSPLPEYKGPISEMKLVNSNERHDERHDFTPSPMMATTHASMGPPGFAASGYISPPVNLATDIMTLSALDVKRATRNFSNKIGEGGFGPVYYGKLPRTHQEVAVKVQSATSRQGAREFTTEVAMLSRAKHPNLVALVGHCQEGKESMLIYEFLAGGTLQEHLYGLFSRNPLSWKTRLKIAVDAAKGLEYLHNDCQPSIIHRDVKSNNILLTPTFDAKVADFGLSKFLETQAGYVSTVVKGTSGYLDPEYFESKRLTKKSDVYSFGIVLLEIITAREPLNTKLPRPQWKISDWTRLHLQDGHLEKVVDKALEGNYNENAMWKVAELAMTCVEPRSVHRPTISDLVIELQAAVELEGESEDMLRHARRDDAFFGSDDDGATPPRQYNSRGFPNSFPMMKIEMGR